MIMKKYILIIAALLCFVACEKKGSASAGTAPVIVTGKASAVTYSSATLSASFSDAASAPREVGFEWGTERNSLKEAVQSKDIITSASGSWTATIDNLADGVEYFYRAYAVFMEKGQGKYYYGPVESFTTPEAQVPDEQAGWFELPVMTISTQDGYMVNSTNSNEYYAYHICAGGEKGPEGRTARNYTVCYSGEHHCPVWVAAPRHAMYVGDAKRTDAYRRDDKIPGDIQYSAKTTGGGCNKGHMLGSAERTSSTESNRQVFYYTNIAPQLSAGFNTGGGGWNNLEDWVDRQVCADTLYEVIGCYFDRYTDGYGETVEPETITFGGRDDVHKPTMFYYVLLRTKDGNAGKSLDECTADELKCAAFVRSHSNNLKGQKVTGKEMMPVAELERIVGVTFFPNVPEAPKETCNPSDWGL